MNYEIENTHNMICSNIENVKTSGMPNLNNGPSTSNMSDSVDRESVPTRVNSTPTAPYSANFSNMNNVAEHFNNSNKDSNSTTYDYLDMPENAYNYRVSEYFNQQLAPVDSIESFNSFNSMTSGYADAF